ncbi:MAG: hypothetical protein AMXMBFR72_34430 [Betaproteobacteria bacterium]
MKASPFILRHCVSVAAALCATFATLVLIDALAARPLATADSLAAGRPAAVATHSTATAPHAA